MVKLIDEKGKFFGKINIVDFLVIVFFFCLVPIFYFGYKIMTHKPMVTPQKEFVEIELDCQLIKLKPEVLKLISVGDKGLDDFGRPIGEIISLGESTPYKYELDIGGEEKIVKETTDLRQLKAKLRLKAMVQQDKLYYRERYLVKVGLPFEFGTRKYSLLAIPIQEEKEEIIIELDCQLIKLKPEVLKLISVGDNVLDDFGRPIGEIISLGESAPYKYELDIGGEEKIVKETTDLRQLKAKLRLKAMVQQDKLYYRERYLVKVGLPFEFGTRKYSLLAIPIQVVVVEIKDEIVDLYVVLKKLDEDTLKMVSVGDKEIDKDGKTIAEILSLGKIENDSFEIDLGDGNFVLGERGHKKQISTKMRLRCRIKKEQESDEFYFKGKRIKRNKPFEFKTGEYKVTALVSKSFEEISILAIKEKWISLRVKFTGIPPEIASAVQKGDLEKDAFGKTAGRINSIITNRPSEALIIRENEFIALNHPFQRDLLLSLNVRCIEKEGVYYFKNYPVKMGNTIAFSTDLYSITGLIVGMEIR